jgi:hypothetical protein
MEARADTQARRFARVPFDAPVRLVRHSTGQALELQAHNLSENGVFVETVIPFATGELFRLSFPTHPCSLEEVAAARVSWRRPFSTSREPGQPPGVGLSFLFMSLEDRQALHVLVEAGGVPPRASARAASSRTPVAPRVIPASDPARLTFGSAGETAELFDVGPFGWLLIVTLALAAVASLLLGLQPATI